jgi:hypothetical protein
MIGESAKIGFAAFQQLREEYNLAIGIIRSFEQLPLAKIISGELLTDAEFVKKVEAQQNRSQQRRDRESLARKTAETFPDGAYCTEHISPPSHGRDVGK